MKINDLKYFNYLSQTKSFTKAAQYFHISQPTISLAIKRLEKELQTKLIKRKRPTGVFKITETGQILFNSSKEIIKNEDLTKKEIQQFNSKKIRLGLPPIISQLYFPLILDNLIKNHLINKLNVDENGSQQLLSDLLTSKIDIALIASPLTFHNLNLSTIPLVSRNFKIIASKDHWLKSYSSIPFSALKNENFISFTKQFIHLKVLSLYSKQAGFTPKVIFKTQSVSLLKKLIQKNAGISLLVGDVVKKKDYLKIVNIKNSLPEKFNISIAMRRNYILNYNEQAFITELFKLKSKIKQT